MVPAFQTAVEEDQKKASSYYKAILGAQDTLITDNVLDIFVTNIFYIGENFRTVSKEILEEGIKNLYVKTPRQIILSYYLILSALFLDNAYDGEEFKKTFSAYKNYVGSYKAHQLRNL